MSKRKSMAAGKSVVSRAEVIVEDEPEITPSEEEIAKLAYSYWQAGGSIDGSAEDDWMRAEHELKAKTQTPR